MADIQEQAQSLIEHTLKLAHTALSKNPSLLSEARDLSSVQHSIIESLDENSFVYKTLLTSLAIDSYATQITKQASMLEEASALMTIVFQKMNKLEDEINSSVKEPRVIQSLELAYQSFTKLVQIHQDICPKSAYIPQLNALLQNQTKGQADDQIIEHKLKEQNEELRKQLRLNDEKLLAMEFKLAKLLKECEKKFDNLNGDSYAGNTVNQSRHNMMNYLELKEELSFKQAEIERMNQQFSYEIQKYNTVYDAMKRELEDLRAYQNIDLIEQIQLLQTQIVRLREERQRDQLIIKQLRTDSMMLSGGNTHLSPRNNGRYHNSRYNY